MNNLFLRIQIGLLLFLLMFGSLDCSDFKSQEIAGSILCEIKENAISENPIKKVGELQFRRSYADIQFRDMSDEELESIEKSNPYCFGPYPDDSALVKRLRSFRVTDEYYGLKRFLFKTPKSKKFILEDAEHNRLPCAFVHPEDSSNAGRYDLVIPSLNVKYRVVGYYGMLNEDIKFLLVDLIPGGYKEIVVLNEYYIMNGDNSDLFIYEVKDIHEKK
mgnify:CR=1 FL=1